MWWRGCLGGAGEAEVEGGSAGRADLLDVEEEEGDERDGGRSGPAVLADHHERQRPDEEHQEGAQRRDVREDHRRVLDPLARRDVGDERLQRRRGRGHTTVRRRPDARHDMMMIITNIIVTTHARQLIARVRWRMV